jgi:hypothetical protein
MKIRRKKESAPYEDLLCRCSLADTGEIPRTPPLEESPDVIPSGAVAVEDPKTYFTGNYEQKVSKPVIAGQQNLIYVRGKNLGELDQNGDVYVYWAPQDQRNDPSVWQRNQLVTSDGHESFPVNAVPPDAVLVATSPFVWTPDPGLADKQVALLGVLATNEHPNPIPSLRPPFDFDAWIARRGGIGTLETKVEPAPVAAKTFYTNARFAMTNLAGVVTFTLRTSNVPVGSTVSFQSSKPDKDGNPIAAGPTRVTINPFVFTVDAPVDANFDTRVTFELTLPGGQLPTLDNYVSLAASQLPQATGSGPVKPVLLAQYNTQIKAPISTT